MNNTRMHHVLYIITKLELGGAQKVCLTLFKELPRHHPIKTSLISGTEGALVSEVTGKKNVYLLPALKREVAFFSIFREVYAFWQLYKAISLVRSQDKNLIVHTHSTKAGIVGRWAAFFAGVKKRVHTVHGFGFHEHQNILLWSIHYFLELITSFITTHYLCVCERDRKRGAQLIPGFFAKSSVIYAAVDSKKFFIPPFQKRTFDKKEAPFIFGTISCFKPQKNLFDLLKAFKHMYHSVNTEIQRRLELHIIGDGDLRPSLEQWIITNGFQGSIKLLGWQSSVALHLHRWKVFVLSSLWEGLPCAIIEARLSKLPVIAYNVGGIAEVIFDTKNGFLIPPHEWQTLSKKMALLVKDELLRQSMGLFDDTLGAFHNEKMVGQHLTLYRTL